MDFKLMVLGYLIYLIKRLLNFLLPHLLLKPNRKFKNIHRGETCFILGSGLSIKNQDLTKLSGKIVMTQNNFHAHKDIAAIKPKYHVIVPKYQPEKYDQDWRDWVDTMDKRLPKEAILFAGGNTKYIIDKFENFKDRTYYIQAGINHLYMGKAIVDITREIMNIPTALTECLTIALYMGFKNIYLVGFDLNQVCMLQNDIKNIRFYGVSCITRNEAEKEYQDKNSATGRDWFWMWEIWQQLKLLREYAQRHGIQVVNATDGGLLNLFPRRDFNDVIQ